ncbi:MAG: polymer-forming cytoskeletal protein [Clostridia bacterium]|nr:polymer-forming cytoskeletal protein [Clostridia bacterium]
MFKKKKDINNVASVDTIVGKGTSIEGKLVSEGVVRIDGTFEGELNVEGDLVIGEAAQVKAVVQARNLLVVGSINGNIVTTGQLEIASTGKIKGDVETARLIIEAGGLLQGNCKMSISDEV